MTDNNPPDVFQADFCAERMKALSDPHRIRIVDVLREGELTVSDITLLLECDLANISHHLKILKHASLVEVRRDGRYMYYSLPEEIYRRKGRGTQYLDLGCCRIEIPSPS